MMKSILYLLSVNLLLISFSAVRAQEYLAPLSCNTDLLLRALKKEPAGRPASLTIPFFEDFTGNDVYPSPDRWSDIYVYVNNTMPVNPISRGVATFDALNEKGVPYDTLVAYSQVMADSLTSQAISLSAYGPVDSLYLSFWYQPQGNGFAPKNADSFMLYFLRSTGVWQQVWAVGGDTLTPFRQVMIPVHDTGYFHDGFRMRWVNKATKGISDSHWNLDYIHLDKERSVGDTSIRDVAFTQQPNSILNDFYAMPYRHFRTNPSSFLARQQVTAVRNNGSSSQNLNLGYSAKVRAPETVLGSGTISFALTPYAEDPVLFPMYNTSAFSAPDGAYVFESRYYCNSVYPGESRVNDTIVHNQVFDNYFAYDDGSAEKAYYLHLLSGAPGTTLVEYALYAPDTLRGLAVRFAAQVPSAIQKEFMIVVYKDIAVNGGSDNLVYQEDFFFPRYEDSLNKFSVYSFAQPLYMEPGVFYIGIVQPAGGLSDSLYIALDANRAGANHRYFKVENTWEPSQLPGALLMRPLLGAELPLAISILPDKNNSSWRVLPNPATENIFLENTKGDDNNALSTFRIYDLQGKAVLSGVFRGNRKEIAIGDLVPGMYLLRMESAGTVFSTKLLKQ